MRVVALFLAAAFLAIPAAAQSKKKKSAESEKSSYPSPFGGYSSGTPAPTRSPSTSAERTVTLDGSDPAGATIEIADTTLEQLLSSPESHLAAATVIIENIRISELKKFSVDTSPDYNYLVALREPATDAYRSTTIYNNEGDVTFVTTERVAKAIRANPRLDRLSARLRVSVHELKRARLVLPEETPDGENENGVPYKIVRYYVAHIHSVEWTDENGRVVHTVY